MVCFALKLTKIIFKEREIVFCYHELILLSDKQRRSGLLPLASD